MKRALIVGATGFGGLGLIEILLRHPHFTLAALTARKDTGKPVSDIFPHLKGICDMVVTETGQVDLDSVDIAFFSTPDRAGMEIISPFIERNIPVIDFSGDFRFSNLDDYAVYAANKSMDTNHLAPELLGNSVYGLPEMNREAIRHSRVIGNPGCFAAAMTLGLLPAVERGLTGPGTIICDGKTGVSGAGKNSGEANLYPQRHENVNTYREGKHQHLVEVENALNLKGGPLSILFVPQIVPINRGILMTMYAQPSRELSTGALLDAYRDYYRDEPFVKISDSSIGTAQVRGSNLCLIRPFVDQRTGMMVITSVIDNLLKGQAGNAVQNANLIFGFNETAGLPAVPFYP